MTANVALEVCGHAVRESSVSSDLELEQMSWVKDSHRTGVGGDRYISIERLHREMAGNMK